MAIDNGKQSKYQGAINKATGGGHDSDAPVMPAGPMVSKVGEGDLAAMLAEQGYEYAPQVKQLEEGDRVSGILEGNGPMVEFEDHETGEAKEVQTWIIAAPDGSQRISILSSAQLDTKCPPFVGGPVDIVRGKDIKTSNGRRVTDYLVRGPKRKDGQRRNFVQPPKMIEAAASEQHKALPETSAASAAPVAAENPAAAS